MNTGYRWFKVNNFLYVYTGTSLTDSCGWCGVPQTEVLAYVQQHGDEDKFRALKAVNGGSPFGMQIPPGSLADTILKVEEFILSDRMNKEIQGVTSLDK